MVGPFFRASIFMNRLGFRTKKKTPPLPVLFPLKKYLQNTIQTIDIDIAFLYNKNV